jgi:hypothetical protein
VQLVWFHGSIIPPFVPDYTVQSHTNALVKSVRSL